ncbi:MAG: hypothetical protein ABIF10_00875 [Candidatus Woesearchaeota archaeon]
MAVKGLELLIPRFRDKNQNLDCQGTYLGNFSISNAERFKRQFKTGLAISISLVFWVYLSRHFFFSTRFL